MVFDTPKGGVPRSHALRNNLPEPKGQPRAGCVYEEIAQGRSTLSIGCSAVRPQRCHKTLNCMMRLTSSLS